MRSNLHRLIIASPECRLERIDTFWKDSNRLRVLPFLAPNQYRYRFQPIGTITRNDSSLSSKNGERNPEVHQAEHLIANSKDIPSALLHYKTLVENQKSPSLCLLKSLLRLCLRLNQTRRARDIWKEMQKCSIDHDCFQLLARACGKSGDSILAKEIFEKIKKGEFGFILNSIDCTQMVQALSSQGKMEDSIGVLEWMLENGIKPQAAFYICLLKGCKDLSAGKIVHARMIQTQPESSVMLKTSLLNMYAKCGSMDLAFSEFDGIQSRDIVSWNAIMGGYEQNGDGKRALELFKQMQQEGVKPNHVTFTIALSACADLVGLTFGREIHSQIDQQGTEWTVELKNSLLNMYAKCGSMGDACSVFDSMRSKNVISWTSLIAGYGQNGDGKRALQLFKQMQQEGIQPNHVTFTVALSACADLLDSSLGREIHSQIDKSGINWTIEMKNSLLNMYAQSGRGKEALELFKKMQQEGVQPTHVTFTIALSACADLAALSIGREIHSQIDKKGIEWTIEMKNSLLHMYAKCGSMGDACYVFENMNLRNTFSWNAMIAGYGQNGDGGMALQLFKQMKKDMIQPDSATFVALLNACSHAGLVDEALHYLNIMKDQYQVSRDVIHYNCVVDALSRAGRLKEAENLIRTMKQPDLVTWKTLLGACRWNSDIERAERAAENALKLDPRNASVYVLLSSIYSIAERWDDAAKVRDRMNENGVKKIPGKTWIDINGKVHTFLANDNSHESSREIQAELKKLYNKMRESGYIPNTKFVTHGINEEEKENYLCSHSEKLAIGLGLISTPPESPLLIAKNLRVCPDCHSATKAISKLCNREITVRDANRFHHFKNGECSCKDYW